MTKWKIVIAGRPEASLTRGEHEAGDKAAKKNQLNFLSAQNSNRKIPESILNEV